MKTKIIIWGYPLNSHTHSYVHAAWVKAFKSLGFETYWFNDNNYPLNFDYKNCIFISEGYADKNIPLEETSTYFIHIAVNPKKYLEKGCRLIDIRFNVDEINDCNYSFKNNKNILTKIDSVSFYDKRANDDVLGDKFRLGISGYEALYLSWATDLLPSEINFDDRFIERDNKYYLVGTIAENNVEEVRKFYKASSEKGIEFVHINPWSNPVSFEDGKKLVQKSYIAPDLRGSALRTPVNGKIDTGANHKLNGYIPCRTFKNISYGQLGATNSLAVKELFGDLIIYNDDEYQLFFDAEKERKNYNLIFEQMKYVKENHTYINRINALLKIYNREI